MTTAPIETLRYPIGRFRWPQRAAASGASQRGTATGTSDGGTTPEAAAPTQPAAREAAAPTDPAPREVWIAEIEALPGRLREAVAGLDDEQLDTPYREGGWTVRQVAHHLPDSHVNGYVRLTLALTEDAPVIRPYDEAAWAELPFARTGPLEPSLVLLDGLHARWAATLRSLGPDQLEREWEHPESGRHSVDDLIALYAWHCRHHVAHIRGLRERMGW